MNETAQPPGIGVAAAIWRSPTREHLLLGLGHSVENRESIYALPGGHWESGESLVQAVRRECLEEAGVEIAEPQLASVYEFFNRERSRSYVAIGFQALHAGGEPAVREPDKKAHWGWYVPQDALALPLFEPDAVLIRRILNGVIYESPPES